jgi:hypothetical protein
MAATTEDEYRTTHDREQVERARRPWPAPSTVRRVRVEEPGALARELARQRIEEDDAELRAVTTSTH